MTIKIMDITPDMAQEMLTHNIPNNRKIDKRIYEYAREMKEGKWALTHQGIAFNEKGELIDGQHRLLAITKAGVAVKMVVAYDVEDENALYSIDIGGSRTPYQLAMINGEEDLVVNMQGVAGTILKLFFDSRSITGYHRTLLIKNNDKLFRQTFEVINRQVKQIPHMVTLTIMAALANGIPFEILSKFYRLWKNNDVTGLDDYNAKCVLNYKKKLASSTLLVNNAVFEELQGILHCFICNTQKARSLTWYPIKEKINMSFLEERK